MAGPELAAQDGLEDAGRLPSARLKREMAGAGALALAALVLVGCCSGNTRSIS